MKTSPKLSPSRWRLYVLIAICATLFSLWSWNQELRWGLLVDNAAHDSGYNLRPALSASTVADKLPRSEDIVIIDLPHEVSRPVLADLIKNLKMAKAVALDLMLVDRNAQLSEDEQPYFEDSGDVERWKREDKALASAIKEAGNVIVGSWPEMAPGGRTIGWAHSASEFEKGARARVHLKVVADPEDGFIRRVRLWEKDSASGQKALPALSLQVAALATGKTPQQLAAIDYNRELDIDYLGTRKVFEGVASHRVVLSSALFYDPDDFKDKLVFVGQTDFRSKDVVDTPCGEMPGLFVHVNATATLLDQRGIPAHLPPALVALLSFGAALLLVVPLTRSSFWACALIAVIEIGLLWLLVAVAWAQWRLLIPLSVPALAVSLTYNLIALYEYARTRRTIEHLVGPTMLVRLLEGPTDPELGGKEAEATAFFCDLRGFSQWAQTRTAQELIVDLNAYTSTIVGIVQSFGGRPIDYFGDGVFVLFEGPDHARRGVEAGVAVARALEVELPTPLRAGIALHTGSMIIGLVGHSHHYKPGAVGEVVNIASRLQSLSDDCGYSVLMTQETRDSWQNAPLPAETSLTAEAASCGSHTIKGYENTLEVFGLEPINDLIPARKLHQM